MKRIIIPVDFTKYSEYALETAASLAKSYNSELIVMHMLELSESIFSTSSNNRNAETVFNLKLANQRFEAFLDKPYLEDITVTPMIKNRKVFKELDAITKELDVDLIVIGSRGHNDYDGVFTGSNTEKVVRYSNTPVLVVKSKPAHIDFGNIVLATDFAQDSKDATKKAVKLFQDLNADITLLHINLPNLKFASTDEIEEKVDAFLKDIGHKDLKDSIVYIADYNVENAIFSYTKKYDTNAIAVITQGRKGLSHLFGGSISEDVVNHAKLPVITFKK